VTLCLRGEMNDRVWKSKKVGVLDYWEPANPTANKL